MTIGDFNESRRRLLARLEVGSLVADGVLDGGLGAAVLCALAPPTFAARWDELEAEVLLTAAALESTLVTVYSAATVQDHARRDVMFASVVTQNLAQHEEHRKAISEQLERVGARTIESARPAYLGAPPAPPPPRPRTLTGLAVQLATLEWITAEAFGSDAALLEGAAGDLLAAVADAARWRQSSLHGGADAPREAGLIGRRAQPQPRALDNAATMVAAGA